MILNDSKIEEYIDNGKITVDPLLDRDEQIQPASLDVRIDGFIEIPSTRTKKEFKDEVVIPPRTPVQGWTLERVEFDTDIAALFTGRSSVGRQGIIVHKTAGWLDPGFKGQIKLEIYNFNYFPVKFEVGERVAQLIFMPTMEDSEGYDGQYQGQMPEK